KSKMDRLVPPTNQEAAQGKQQVTAEKIEKTIEKEELKAFNETATRLLEDHDSVSIISAALKLLTKERKDVPVRISSVQPISVKSGRGGGRRSGKGRGRGDSNRRNHGGGKRCYNKRKHGGQDGNQNRRKGGFKKHQNH